MAAPPPLRRLAKALLALGIVGGVVAIVVGSSAAPLVEPLSGLDSDSPGPGADVAPAVGAALDAGTLRGAGSGRGALPLDAAGRVSLRVTRAVDGSALPGVYVTLAGAAQNGTAVSLRTFTDERGIGRFADVPAGATYVVRVLRTTVPAAERTGVVVRAGEETNLGTIPLESSGIVDALVLDEARNPITGAVVSVSIAEVAIEDLDADPWPLPPALPGEFARGTTDDRGRVRIEGVTPGTVSVRASATARRARTARVAVPAEGPKSAFVPFVLERGDLYGGSVVRADGRRVVGADVEFGSDDIERFVARAATRTDGEGVFHFEGADGLGEAAFRVRAEGGFEAIVAARPRNPVRITLRGGATLALRLVDEADGRPVGGARVVARAGPDDVAGTRLVAVSDAAGSVEFPVTPGAVPDLTVLPKAHATVERPSPARTLRGGSQGNAAGRVVGDLDAPIGLSERREATVRLAPPWRLSGDVVTPAEPNGDRPLPGAEVRLLHGGVLVGSVTTNARGAFVLEGLLLDRRPLLEVVARGHVHRTLPLTRPPKDREYLVSPPIRLVPVSPIAGRVLDARGRPLVGAWVRFAATGTSVMTGRDGEFRLPAPPGDPDDPSRRGWRVRVAHGGRAAEAVATPRPPGESGPYLRIVVSDVTDVVGVALERVGGTRLRFPVCELVLAASGVVIDSKVGGEFGDMRFLDVPEGSYFVRVRTSERAGSASVVVRDGRTIPTFAHVNTQPVEAIDGTLVDEHGRPAAGVPLRLDVPFASARTLPGLRTTTDPQGRFRFVLYEVRHDDVEVDGQGYGKLRDGRVRAGRTNELEIVTGSTRVPRGR